MATIGPIYLYSYYHDCISLALLYHVYRWNSIAAYSCTAPATVRRCRMIAAAVEPS